MEYMETAYTIAQFLQSEIKLNEAKIGLVEESLDDFDFNVGDVEILCKDYRDYSL